MTFWDFILKVWVSVTVAYLLAFVLSAIVFSYSETQTTGRFLVGFSFFFPASLLIVYWLTALKPLLARLLKFIKGGR